MLESLKILTNKGPEPKSNISKPWAENTVHMSGCGGVDGGPPKLWEIMRLTPESGGVSHPLFQTQ